MLMSHFILVICFLTMQLAVEAQISPSCKDKNLEYSSESLIVKFKESKTKNQIRKFRNIGTNYEMQSITEEYFPISSNLKLSRKQIIQNIKSQELKNKLGLDRTYKLLVKRDCSQLKTLVKQLNLDPSVEYAELDLIAKVNFSPNDTLFNSTGSTWNYPFDEMWGTKRIATTRAWNTSQGAGVIIAVIDTGVDYNHPDLWDNIWVDPNLSSDINHDGKIDLNDIDKNHNHVIEDSELDKDYIGHDFNDKDTIPEDYNRHGTHIAGIAAASGNNNKGVIGVAFKSKIMVLKGFANDGRGRYSNLAQAIMSAADRGAHITNNAWSGESSRTITNAFKYAYDLGLVNVTAAGNDNNEAAFYSPANLNTTITVASINPIDDSRTDFSNYGSSVDIAAPGAYITSTLSSLRGDNAARFVGYGPPYEYWYSSGTSIASPFVSGVAALILSANPKLNNKQVKDILISSAEHLNTDRDIGGLVNAANAVQTAKNTPIKIKHPRRK